MLVLMVSTEYPPMQGGVGRYTANLTKALTQADVNEAQESNNRTNDDKVEVRVVCDDRGDGQYSGIHPRNFQNSYVLLELVERVKPDIVHIQFEPGLYGLRLASPASRIGITNIDGFYLKCRVPIVTTFHSVYTLRHWMGQTLIVKKNGKTGYFGVPARAAVRLWRHFINYKAFVGLNRQKLRQSTAGIVFSNSIREMLGGGEVMYHGAEPALSMGHSKEQSRAYFSLDSLGDKNHSPRIALAVGFRTALKGWDIIHKMPVPDGWIVVTNSSMGYYSTENTDAKKNDVGENQIRKNRILDLQMGFLSDQDLSRLFFASDAVLLPYKITSGSGVMFDALAHGLPFVATDLDFFKEFSKNGLGITVKRKPSEFARGLELLNKNYIQYTNAVKSFKEKLNWNYIAKEHLKIYNQAVNTKKS